MADLGRRSKGSESKRGGTSCMDFENWKGEFSVDSEGTTENKVQDGGQDLLSDFVEYIKECINRITSVESMGQLSGVMDDRGKYIYISPEEMHAVADNIKRQGRASISHLASKSNQFIDLETKAQFAEDISCVEEISVS